MTLETWVAIAAAVFCVVILWRVRPMLPVSALPLARAEGRKQLLDAQIRIREAKDDETRAKALCDAADVCAEHRRYGSARGYLHRATRLRPDLALTRGLDALAKNPRSLDAFVWRALADAESFEAKAAATPAEAAEAPTAPKPESAVSNATLAAALSALAETYRGPLRKRTRGKALAILASRVGTKN
jgi:hypothetical protein